MALPRYGIIREREVWPHLQASVGSGAVTEPQEPSLPSTLVRAGFALVPGVGGALAELWAYAQDRDRWRVSQVGETLRDAVGDDDRLIRRLSDNERLMDMLVEAGEAARRTSWEAKRITMGRVLAHAVTDDAEIDYDAALVSTLAALEQVHFRLLGQITVDAPTAWSGPKVGEPYRSHLLGHGLVQDGVNISDAQTLYVTQFGHRLMDWIQEAETDLEARSGGVPPDPRPPSMPSG